MSELSEETEIMICMMNRITQLERERDELKRQSQMHENHADREAAKVKELEAELAKVKSENEVLTMQLKCADEGLAKSPGMKLWTRAEKLDADNARLRECLKRIAEHPHCNPDLDWECDGRRWNDLYGVDQRFVGRIIGHRCCADIARKVLKEGE
jgi:chromosome segregation ATPase